MRMILFAALLYTSLATATSLEGTPLRSARQSGPTSQHWLVASRGDATSARQGAPSAPARQPQSDTYRDVYNGWKWWHVYCYRCHGVDAIGTTNAPNLIDPTRKLNSAEFHKIVKNGIPDKGMQAWDKLLDDKQIDQLFLYVRARSEKVLPPGRPDENGPNGGAWVPPNGWPGKSGSRS